MFKWAHFNSPTVCCWMESHWLPVGVVKASLSSCYTVFDVWLKGSTGELPPPPPHAKLEKGEWVAGRAEVLKCSGQTWGRKRAGRGEQDLSNYTIWVTGELFICAVWHISVDLGSCAAPKTDSAEVYLFILQAEQPNRTRLQREELEIKKVHKYTEREKTVKVSSPNSCVTFKLGPSMPCCESCGDVGGGEDMSSICLNDFLHPDTTLAPNQWWWWWWCFITRLKQTSSSSSLSVWPAGSCTDFIDYNLLHV